VPAHALSYIVRQKKGTNFLLCASFQYLTETGEFFHMYKLRFRVFSLGMLRILCNNEIETKHQRQFHYLTGKHKMFYVTVTAKFLMHAKIKYTEL